MIKLNGLPKPAGHLFRHSSSPKSIRYVSSQAMQTQKLHASSLTKSVWGKGSEWAGPMATATRHLTSGAVDDAEFAPFKDTLIRLFQNVGSQKEIQYWLKHYSSQRFALFKVGGGIIEDPMMLDAFCSSVSFLRRVGLFPVIVHGAGPQLNKALKDAGVQSDYIEGIRVTTPQTLQVARKVFQEANLKMVGALESHGTRARPIPASVLNVDFLDQQKYGLVGDVSHIDMDHITKSIESHQVPVIYSLGETGSGQILNVNADIAASEVAKAMEASKIVYVNTNGGLSDDKGNLITSVNFPDDYENLLSQPWVKHGTRLKLKEIKGLLDSLPNQSSVSVTSPFGLTKELFTNAGSGTLFKHTEPIHVYDNFDGIDGERLKALLEKSFDKKLDGGYLKQLESKVHKIILSEDYNATAIVTKEDNIDIPYLCKFAVTAKTQGEGTGNILWSKLKETVPSLYWRSRTENKVNGWYFKRADGSLKLSGSEWTAFWYGVNDHNAIQQCTEVARDITPSFGSSSLSASESKPFTASTAVAQRGSAFGASPIVSFPANGYSDLTTPSDPVRVGLIGARGYVGAELLKLLDNHPHMEIAECSSRALEGQPLTALNGMENMKIGKAKVFSNLSTDDVGYLSSNGIDLWFLALPNGLSYPYVDAIKASSESPVVVDLSGDHRFSEKGGWVYGLPEVPGAREKLKSASFISNPGCYATASQLALLPLLSHLNEGTSPSVFGVSGYSGAGTTPSPKNDLEVMDNNLYPYSLVGHLHEKEMSHQLGVGVHFMPHVASFFRGINVTVNAPLSPNSTITSSSDALKLFSNYYEQEPLVEIGDPLVKDNALQHHCKIGRFTYDDQSGKRLVLNATIDNLLKGAATQALQNANLALGFDEFQGIITQGEEATRASSGTFHATSMAAAPSLPVQPLSFEVAAAKRDFLTLRDFDASEIIGMLDTAKYLKDEAYKANATGQPLPSSVSNALAGKSVAMIFQKRSTRTRVSTETGTALMGGHALFLGKEDIQLGENESMYDTAKVLSRFTDVVLARVYGHEDVALLAQEATVPVINGLSDLYHPLQILADLQTLKEEFGALDGLTLSWVGDGNNILHSLMIGCAKLNINLQVAVPNGYEPNEDVYNHAKSLANQRGSSLFITRDPLEAVKGADCIVTDTWVSMGQEEEAAGRLRDFEGYQVTNAMAEKGGAAPHWKFMHCLPRKPYEVDDEVFYSERSLVYPEAENRKWTVMSVLLNVLGKSPQ